MWRKSPVHSLNHKHSCMTAGKKTWVKKKPEKQIQERLQQLDL